MIRTKQIAPGAANTVLVTNGAGMAIVMALLVNANVDAAAAIAGTKIDPNFGIQNVSTSGTLGAGAGTLTSLTISGLTTGIAHVGVAGAITSSLIVDADIAAGAAVTLSKLAPGAANTVLVTNGAGTAVVTAKLVDANVDTAAAIAGTKINPAFGTQNVSTSGTLGAGAGTLTSLTISALTTGIAHVGVAGAITSSLIVNADVDAAAAIAGSKVTPNFGAQALTAGTGSFGGDVNFNGHKGTSIANGTAASDVAAFGQIPLIASVLPLQDAIDAVIGSAGQYADQNHVHPLRTPASTFSYYEDWATGVATAGGSYGWANTPTGAGAATALTLTALDATHIGIVQLGTGTTATGKATIQNYVGTGGCLFTQSTVSETVHEWWVQLPALSTAAEEYAFRTGIMDGSAAGDAANGIYFEYLRTTDTHWRIATAKASTRTKTNSTVTVTAGAWYRLTWQKAEGAASYDFYINGVFVASIATNIPTALTGPTAKLEKSATTGNVASLAYIDVAAHVETFSVPRAA